MRVPYSRSGAARSSFVKSRRGSLPLAAALLSLLCTFLGALAFSRNWAGDASLPPTASSGVPPFLLPASVRSAGYGANFCDGASPTNFLRSVNRVWLALLLPVIVFTFVGLALVIDDYFVPSLECICQRLDLSADVAGATLMAAGSSAPKFFISMISVFFTGDDVGIGTIVGSAVFNILIIIGLSAVLVRETLQLDFRPFLRDSFFSVVSVVALFVMVLFSTRGQADWWEGLILMGAYLLFVLFMKFANKPYFSAMEEGASAKAAPKPDIENMNSDLSDAPSAEVREPLPKAMEGKPPDDKPEYFLGVPLPTTALGWATLPLFLPWQLLYGWTILRCDEESKRNRWPLTFAASISWIALVSYGMVQAARLAGCFIGIPSSVMGLTMLAAGTGVPDAIASVLVAQTGMGDMAVSNAGVSNVVNILLGLGLPWFIGGLAKRKAQAVTVEPIGLLVIPIAILFGIIVVLVAVLWLMEWKLSWKLGYVLCATYAVFVSYSLLDVFVFKIGGTRLHR